jgi:hypothetical protein
MDARLLPAEHQTGVCPELSTQRHLILPLAGTRQQRPRLRELAAALTKRLGREHKDI